MVGRFTGSQAPAAVGSTTALINMFVNLFIGVSLGANVLSARFYAAGKEREMSETVHTAMTFALISGIVMVFVGLFCTRGALELMDTPADVIDQAALYMKIYFCSMPFFMLYNYGAAVLRAVGDTKRPLLFLIISGAINAVLNLFLVIAFSMGVAGVAIATVISQVISGVPCIMVPVYYGQLLPAADFKAGNKRGVSAADLSGGGSGGDPERCHQFLQCSAAVLGEFLRLHRHGRLYGGQ